METVIKGLIEVAVLSSVMIAGVLGLRALFAKKLDIRVLSVLWILVIARLMLPVTIGTPFHISELVQKNLTSEEAVESGEVHTQADSRTDINEPPDISLDALLEREATAVPDGEPAKAALIWSGHLWEMIFMIWAIGMLAALAINLVRICRFRRGIKSQKPVIDGEILKMLYIGGNKLGIHLLIRVYECRGIDSPITSGTFRPKILLPEGLLDAIGTNKTELILFHEMAHIKRRDVLKNHLWLLAKIIYWFNPLIYLGNNAYLEDIELACDDMVLKRHNHAQVLEYSQGLLDVIRMTQGGIKTPAVISFCKDKSKIRKRVENMLKPTKKSKWMTLITIIVTMVLIVGCFTTACTQSGAEEPVKAVNTEEETPDSQIPEDTNTHAAAGHIESVLESDRYVLNINADIADYSDREITVYSGSPKLFEEDEWIDRTFFDMTKSQLTDRNGDVLARSNMTAAEAKLVEQGFSYEYIWPEDAGGGVTSLLYQPNWAYIGASSYYLVPDEAKQRETLTTTIDQCEEAAAAAQEFMDFVGADDFYVNEQVKALPEYNYYEFTFEKKLDGIDLLYDRPITGAYEGEEMKIIYDIDRIQMFIRDNKVIDFGGFIRDIQPEFTVEIISPDSLIDIIEANMDDIDAFSSKSDPNSERAEFDIDSIALKYYAVAHLDAELADSQAYVSYVPVYVVSSGVRISSNMEYVMIIDAVTGDVLNKHEMQVDEPDEARMQEIMAESFGSDLIASYTGDYIDNEVTYINKKTGEEYTYTADNAFYWLIDSQDWAVLETADVTDASIGYSEYIDIRGWHLVNNGDTLALYHDNEAVIFETDTAIFGQMADMIKGK